MNILKYFFFFGCLLFVQTGFCQQMYAEAVYDEHRKDIVLSVENEGEAVCGLDHFVILKDDEEDPIWVLRTNRILGFKEMETFRKACNVTPVLGAKYRMIMYYYCEESGAMLYEQVNLSMEARRKL